LYQFPPAAYIEWRIKEMIQENTISCKGDTTKSARDYEIKKVGSPVEIEEAVAEEV
jgi:hypothetical protein